MNRPPDVVLVVQLFRVFAGQDAVGVPGRDRALSRLASFLRTHPRHATPGTQKFKLVT